MDGESYRACDPVLWRRGFGVPASSSSGAEPSLSASLAARARAMMESVSSAVGRDLTLELDVRRSLEAGGDARCEDECATDRRIESNAGDDVTSECWRFLE